MADDPVSQLLSQYYGTSEALGTGLATRAPRTQGWDMYGEAAGPTPAPQLGQHNFLHSMLSAPGQPTLNSLDRGLQGLETPQGVALSFFENGPIGPFGMARRPEWRLPENVLGDLLSPRGAAEAQARLRRMLTEIAASPQDAAAIRSRYGMSLTDPPPAQRSRRPAQAPRPVAEAVNPVTESVPPPAPMLPPAPALGPPPIAAQPLPPAPGLPVSVDPNGIIPGTMFYHGRPARGLQYFTADELSRGLRRQGLNWIDEERGYLHYLPGYGNSWRPVAQLTPDQLRAYLGPDLANHLLSTPMTRSPNAAGHQSHRLHLPRFNLGEYFERNYGQQ